MIIETSFVEVRCEIHAGCAEVDNFDVGAALILATESLDGERSEPIIAEEYVT
jgi:hypothetical protein